jgi:hypothetical protein
MKREHSSLFVLSQELSSRAEISPSKPHCMLSNIERAWCLSGVVPVFKSEDCLDKATECDEIARAEDQEDLKIYYRALAEHWRTLAQIAAQKTALRLSVG